MRRNCTNLNICCMWERRKLEHGKNPVLRQLRYIYIWAATEWTYVMIDWYWCSSPALSTKYRSYLGVIMLAETLKRIGVHFSLLLLFPYLKQTELRRPNLNHFTSMSSYSSHESRGFSSCGMWLCVEGFVVSDACKDHNTFIIKLKHLNLKTNALRYFCTLSLLVFLLFLSCSSSASQKVWVHVPSAFLPRKCSYFLHLQFGG